MLNHIKINLEYCLVLLAINRNILRQGSEKLKKLIFMHVFFGNVGFNLIKMVVEVLCLPWVKGFWIWTEDWSFQSNHWMFCDISCRAFTIVIYQKKLEPKSCIWDWFWWFRTWDAAFSFNCGQLLINSAFIWGWDHTWIWF